jgi:hypothetical protein
MNDSIIFFFFVMLKWILIEQRKMRTKKVNLVIVYFKLLI